MRLASSGRHTTERWMVTAVIGTWARFSTISRYVGMKKLVAALAVHEASLNLNLDPPPKAASRKRTAPSR